MRLVFFNLILLVLNPNPILKSFFSIYLWVSISFCFLLLDLVEENIILSSTFLNLYIHF